MIRPTFRRSLRLETLESRELLTAGGPSAEAQAMLSMINLARTNPAEAAKLFTQNLDPNVQATVDYYGVDLNKVASDISSAATRPPLAWNSQLAQAATAHSQDMADNGFQSHNGSNGSTTEQRLDSAGYTNRTVSGENAYAYATSVDQAMEAFLIDWGVSDHGHRNNLLQPDSSGDRVYREVGIGIVSTNKANIGPEVITQDFGSQVGAKAQVVGVVYNDPSHSHHYALGQGAGNIQIQATDVNTGATSTTQTWDNGGYQIALNPGSYKITATDNGQVVNTQQVSVGSDNVEVDFNLSDPWTKVSDAPTPAALTASTPATISNSSSGSWSSIPATMLQQNLISPISQTSGNAGRGWYSGWSSWTARKTG